MATKRTVPDNPGSPGTPSKKRKVLTLGEKVKVIQDIESGLSQRTVATKFGVGCTQIHNILTDREIIQKAFREGTNSNIKYLQPRNLKYLDLDQEVYDFFCDAHAKNIPVTGALLQRHAHIVALKQGHDSFTASNGWLELFTSRHQLKLANLHGESAEVSEDACQQCHSFPKNASDYHHHAFKYRFNKKAWMTTEIFKEYVNWLNNKMIVQQQKILLFLDNCPAHPVMHLSNVKLVFLPKNTTAVLQPMDARVIAWVKNRYQRLMMGNTLELMNEAMM